MLRLSALSVALALPLVLTGCALTNTASPVLEQGNALQGRVQGGQQPVVGARVYLLAANNTGYPTATTNASKSLMKFVSGSTSLDIATGPTNGFYYVTTDSQGNFSISGDYSCTSGQQAYLYVVGGNPGAGVNTAAGFLAVLGNCPAAGNYAVSVPFLFVNEVTTIASAYSIAGFSYDALHVSSPNSALSRRYLQNAFSNANNIVDITSGIPYTNLPAGNGSGAPNTINTLANVLASCVNSTGPTSTTCQTLFTLAKTNGTSGTAPTDTATAAINIAHNQGSNAAALFGLLGANQAFNPSYTTAPADFSLPIKFTSPELGGLNGVALDAQGNVWISTYPSPTIATSVNGFSQFSPQGVHLATVLNTTGYTGSLSNVAVTAEGTVVANIGPNYVQYVPGAASVTGSTGLYSITDFAETGGALVSINQINNIDYYKATYAPGSNDSGRGFLAIDGLGNAWASNLTTATLSGWNSAGTRITPATAGYSIGATGTFGVGTGIAIDQKNNIWAAGTSASGTGQVTRFSSAGTVLATFTDSNMTAGNTVYVDGANNVLFFGSGGSDYFVQLDSNGNLLQTYGRVGNGSNPHNIALDGSGNTWSLTTGGVYQFIGLTAPVVTPIAANLVSPYTTPASKPQ